MYRIQYVARGIKANYKNMHYVGLLRTRRAMKAKQALTCGTLEVELRLDVLRPC